MIEEIKKEANCAEEAKPAEEIAVEAPKAEVTNDISDTEKQANAEVSNAEVQTQCEKETAAEDVIIKDGQAVS